ncbi:hypothetical protein Gasu2_59440 [Galdieria sulphuraria]|uniref:Ribosomal protein L30 ferredoxin-like fold domain-containing protein n=1 Tax=Galdieria sulphuraria TaxID=130081 RepID=M2Y4P0_GALSU|nr:hypothetical protein Gasu_16780 isoform 2 [Galdieria sulphuraria]XP_005707429.1 hypothetical protein Gasu_16780 isoform 1 [Galdieria sulphuraria]EME30908.1 hypothetical protein Gasu_16780 isoform 2 [Galdieria sulphuraria]EME30909.1 hypothetical protein Gasu_16780 isoform 1 [Galdieria sulphuraria]GJD11819.1 hypothetical protein Gasu2_59440 [Galdieria sulphuraria]|eukprot:XP_005707428.1 hypothetical protein isoform 2 [Galdieria sulphuraria]
MVNNALLNSLSDTRLIVTLRRSFIRKHRIKKEILEKLGITKIHKAEVVLDGVKVWNDLKKVVGLVEIERVAATEAEKIARERPRLPRPSYQKPKFVPYFQTTSSEASSS